MSIFDRSMYDAGTRYFLKRVVLLVRAMKKVVHSAVLVGLLVQGCGRTEPSPKAASAAPAGSAPLVQEKADAGSPSTEPVASCTMTKALSESCAPCAKAHCCAPPMAFTSSKAQSLGCRMGCRKPLPPGAPKLADHDRAAVIKSCIATCDGLFADATGEAARLDECLATQCSSDCLTSR